MDNNQIRQRAQEYLPQNLQTTQGQSQLLTMLEQLVPTVRLSREKTERDRWPKVEQGQITMQTAIESCAYEMNNLLRITVLGNLKLEEKPEEDLLKAWAALDYYVRVSRKPEYAEYLQAFRNALSMALLRRKAPAAQSAQPSLFREVTDYQVPEEFAQAENAPEPEAEIEDTGRTQFPEDADLRIPTIHLEFQEDPGQTVISDTQFLKTEIMQEDIGKTVLSDEWAAKTDNTQKTENRTVISDAASAGKGKKKKPDGGNGKKKMAGLLAVAAVAALVLAVPLLNKVSRAERAIDKIGLVSYGEDSRKAIEKAETLCGGMDKDDREKVENYEILLEARAEYNRLETEDAISQIGTVNLESGEAIERAEALFAALTTEEKKTVENYGVLTAARQDYDRYVAAVQQAKDAIDAIGEVTLESGEAIREAREAYAVLQEEGLEDAVADRVSVLRSAEEVYAETKGQQIFEEAEGLYAKKKYKDALAKYDQLSLECPGSAVESRARKNKADCQIALARQTHQQSKLYDAMALLKAVDTQFRTSEDYKTVMDEVINKLTKARPANGKVFKNKADWGWCQIDITAQDTDICVKVIKLTDMVTAPDKYQLVYVRKGETVKVKVADGSYVLHMAAGDHWYDTDHLFGDDTVYAEMSDLPLLYSFTEGYTVYYKRVTVTLGEHDAVTNPLKADRF
ncbi:MAG: hypothetical protein IJB59_06735 [Oscillospiraceae bacterium]|nr:hypothetical protein [Oscillospiraceae bacterium]